MSSNKYDMQLYIFKGVTQLVIIEIVKTVRNIYQVILLICFNLDEQNYRIYVIDEKIDVNIMIMYINTNLMEKLMPSTPQTQRET